MVCVHISQARVGKWQQLAEGLTRKEIEALEFQLNVVGCQGFTAYVSPHVDIDSLLPALEQAK
jgi:hypothetical protein